MAVRDMLTRDEVIWGFRYCLGRDPESDAVIDTHAHFEDWLALRNGLLRSPEFQQNKEFLRYPNRWVMAEVFNKERLMWINLHDRFVSQLCLQDRYEPVETEFVRRHLKPGDHFVDIGANVGWFTMLASTLVGTRGSITAFEPQPEVSSYLRRTIAANKLEAIAKIYDCGLSDADGTAFVSNLPGTDNPGGSFVSENLPGAEMRSDAIIVKTLDSFKMKKVNFIKMDVEGSELKVIRGARETILRNRPTILAEINPIALRNISGGSPDEMLQFFLDLNYEIQIIDEEVRGVNITTFPPDWYRDLMNVALLPK